MNDPTVKTEPSRTEGDVNLSRHRRRFTETHVNAQTDAVLQADADCFVHQSFSGTGVNALGGCEGI